MRPSCCRRSLGYDAADITSAEVPVADYSFAVQEGAKGLRVGVPREYFFDDLDAEVSAALEDALRGIKTMVASK